MWQFLTMQTRDAVVADLATPRKAVHESKDVDIPVSARFVGLGINSKRTDSGSTVA